MPSRARLVPFTPTKDFAGYTLLRGSITRFLWRIYIQRFTAAGRWFAVATAVFVSYGGASLDLQGYVLATYAGAFWLVATVCMLLYRPRVRLSARAPQRICAGETLTVDVEIEQRGRLRGADLFVVPHRLPFSIDAAAPDGVALPDLGRSQVVHVPVALRCTHRGAYVLRGYRVETGFPFGILRARRAFQQEHSLLVYPRFSPLGRLSLPTGRRYQPGGIALISKLGESLEYLGNREYREGDNVRDIDWRATARVTTPIVREWVEEYMLRAAVILDTHVPNTLEKQKAAERRDALERAVSVAAAVSDYMARQEYLVDLFAAGPNLYHLTAGRSLAYLDQILDILACVEETPHEPFELIEPQIAELMERLSTIIFVLLDWDAPRRAFASRLASQGIASKVIILRDGPCTLDPREDVGEFGDIPILSAEDYARGISEL